MMGKPIFEETNRSKKEKIDHSRANSLMLHYKLEKIAYLPIILPTQLTQNTLNIFIWTKIEENNLRRPKKF